MFDTFVQIDGVPGESLDSNHTTWIEVLSFNLGIPHPVSVTTSSAGGTAERTEHDDFTFTKYMDKASPKLYELCSSGKHISSIVVHLNRAGGDKGKYMEI